MFNSWDALQHTLLVGTLGYIATIILLRVSGKRTLSKWNSFDFIVTIAFGSILASLMLSKDTSLVQGVLAIGMLVLFQFIITWVSVRSNIFQGWIKAEPTLLLFQGELQRNALRHQRVSKGEVLAALRTNGLGSLEEAEAVILETDGSFSVIKKLKDASASALIDVKGYPQQQTARV
ncbi:MAG: YetF domain-containing protein [Cyanobacteria bacterium P01_A01_bin.68]